MYPGKREILLFYKETGTVLHNEQLAILNQNKAGLKERDILVQTYKITEQTKEATKRNVPPSASLVFLLIGRDGGEKLRSDSVVSIENLFSVIDAMPMRKQEMKSRNH